MWTEMGTASGFGEIGGDENRRSWYARLRPTGPPPTTKTSTSTSAEGAGDMFGRGLFDVTAVSIERMSNEDEFL